MSLLDTTRALRPLSATILWSDLDSAELAIALALSYPNQTSLLSSPRTRT